MGFFDSPKEIEGRKSYKEMQGLADNLPNSFENINNLEDVYGKYGVKKFDVAGYGDQVRRTFDPQRKILANKQAQAQRSLGDRMGRSATPGIKSSMLDSSFADAFSGLGASEAQGVLGGYDKARENDLNIANLFKGLQEGKDRGAMNKFSAKSTALKNYLDTLSGTSGFDDVLAGVSTVGTLAGGLGAAGGKKGIAGLFGG